MTLVQLDASGWREPSDFYDAILMALGSLSWHGSNPVALLDTMVSGMGAVHDLKPPYRVEILHSAQLPTAVRECPPVECLSEYVAALLLAKTEMG